MKLYFPESIRDRFIVPLSWQQCVAVYPERISASLNTRGSHSCTDGKILLLIPGIGIFG